MLLGAALCALYLAARVAVSAHLARVVASKYPSASSVHVFPAPLALSRWRFVARSGGEYAVGSVTLGVGAVELGRHRAQPETPLPEALRQVPTVREALGWARFPVVTRVSLSGNAERVSIADLRYHLAGQPTLTFVIEVERDGRVRSARLDRGGSAADLLRRFRDAG
jgi:inner membrane protein